MTKNIRSVNFKPGYLTGTTETNLSKLFDDLLLFQGIPLLNSCCGNKNTVPTAGQVLAYDSVSKSWKPTTVAGVASLTNLGYTASSTNGVITNTNGTTATIPLATALLAGLMSPAQFTASNSLAAAATTTQIPFGTGTNGFTSSPNLTWNNTTNEFTINGKLNVSGGIDPIYLQFVESTATLTPTGNTKGAIYVSDGTDGKIKNHLIYKSDVGILTDLLSGGTITSVFGRSTASIVATNGDYTASQITNVPSGSISSTNVQAAITELDLEKANKTLTTLTLTNTDVIVGDTLEVAIGKLQAQLDNTVVPVIDLVPTDASTNSVSSNGVFDALSTKVDKPIASTPGFIATVDATGNNIEYIAAAPTSIPAVQADVTSGTVIANSYVQADTLKVELDKKLDDSQLIDDDTFATALATNIPSAESVKAYVDSKTAIVDNLTSTSNTSSLSANQGKVLQDTKLDKNTAITAGTFTKITYDVDGLVTAGVDANATDIVFTPTGNLSSINVALALAELDTEKASSTLTDGKVLIGSASNVASEQTLSGDVTITNLGVSTVISSTELVAGKVQLATTVEVETGTDTTKAVTPKSVSDTFIKKSMGDNIGDLLVWHTNDEPGILAGGGAGEVLTVDPTNVLVGLSWKPNVSARYVQTFVAADFIVGAIESTLTIPQTSHLMGIYPRVDVDQVNGVDFEQVSVGVTKKSNGDIILTVTNPNTFNGRVIIS